MSQCPDCNSKFGLLNIRTPYKGREICRNCYVDIVEAQRNPKYEQNIAAQDAINQAIDSILLTTETAPNLNITKRIEIVTAECAFGMNIFKDLFAGVRNVVGGRSEAVQKTMRDSRRTALYELKKEAYEVGANAVVGVDLDYVELAGTGSSMVMLVASGTAVVIEETDHA